VLNVTNVFNLRYHGTNQNKTFQTLLIRPNSSFHLQDCGTDGIFSGHQPRQFRKAGQRFEQRTCLHHQISVRRDVTAILDTLIRLKLKTQDVSKHDFVSVFRWEEMNSLLVGPAEQAGHCYCIGVRSSLPPSIWRRGKFRSPKPCGVFNLWRTTTATTLRNSLILSQKCIAPSSQNFKAKRQICWLSLSETIVSSQLKRRVLVEAQSLMKYKGFSYLGFKKIVERRHVLNSLIINPSEQKYRRTVTHAERGSPMCYVIYRIWLALTRRSAIFTHCMTLEFRWEMLHTGRMYCDSHEVRRTAV
jgi:hypothetical protein